jgi:hypothetical protein
MTCSVQPGYSFDTLTQICTTVAMPPAPAVTEEETLKILLIKHDQNVKNTLVFTFDEQPENENYDSKIEIIQENILYSFRADVSNADKTIKITTIGNFKINQEPLKIKLKLVKSVILISVRKTLVN